MIDREADDRLLAAVVGFVRDHSNPEIGRFRDGVLNWGDMWTGRDPVSLPASDTLAGTLGHASSETRALVSLFSEDRHSRHWEQSYRKADGLVGDDMLQGYGFVEIIGKWGPFVSERVRCGIGVWGPNILYPAHRHKAEEVYYVLAGGASFELGEDGAAETRSCGVGEAVFVPSMTWHGFRTDDLPLVVFYIWQAGDLRQTSAFH